MQDIDLTERPQNRDALSEWYTVALAEQADSGLSVAEYADELGVSSATLYQWKRRLSAIDAAEFEAPTSLGLVEVTIEDRPRSSSESAPLVVQLGSGRRVEVPRRFDDADLIRLISILESC